MSPASATRSSNRGPATAQPDGSIQAQPLRVPAKTQASPSSIYAEHGTFWHQLQPLATRYRAGAGNPTITDGRRQDEVVEAILSRLSHLLPDFSGEDRPRFEVFLAVIFDQELIAGDSYACIDLIASTLEICHIVRRNMRSIEVEDEADPQRLISYNLSGITGQLPPDVLPVDFALPRVARSEQGDLIDTLQLTFTSLGSLTGPVRIMVSTTRAGQTFERYMRASVKLRAYALQMGFSQFIDRHPTSLDWKSASYTLFPQIPHLTSYQQFAATHPERCAAPSRRPLSNSSTAVVSACDDGASARSTSKKRKSSGE